MALYEKTMPNSSSYGDSTRFKQRIIYEVVTECIDKIFAIALLILSFPFLLLAIMCMKIEDRGPITFYQERVGKDGKIFLVYKLRSMKINTKQKSLVTKKNDVRITKVGKFIRKTRIDELPQLLNILKGEMKLIGPRPLVKEQVDEFTKIEPAFSHRLCVKPGVTGWAQVNGGNELDPLEKLRYDLEYIENRGPVIYLKIFLKTIWVVISGEGAR